MYKVFMGLILGVLLTSTMSVYANSIQQFILTKISYPVLVGNEVYTSNDLPVLNYEGNTYVPLKAVGDLLGAQVAWNEQQQQVEIRKVKDTSSMPTKPLEEVQDAVSVPAKTFEEDQPSPTPSLSYDKFKSMFTMGSVLPGIANTEKTTTLTYNGTMEEIEFYEMWYALSDEEKRKLSQQLGSEIQAEYPGYDIAIDFTFRGKKLGYVLAYNAGHQLSHFQPPAP